MVFGTFDFLHRGHLNFFKQAKKYGKKLIVVVARDVNVKKAKRHLPKFSEKKRLENIKKIKLVTKAILGDKKDYFKVIKKEKPDVICLGYDQKMKILLLKKKLKKIGLVKTEVYRLSAYKPQIYKSSRLKIKQKVSS
ncbi:MAG: adenylyltransferase/cytidyltransferase family protein [Patescibacteria group bacterium]